VITQCTIHDLYKTKNQEAIVLAKQFERRRCNHLPNKNDQETDLANGPKSAFDCIANVVIVKGTNKHRYVVATQKSSLRSLFRKIPAIPLIYMNRSVMIMEPMSPVTVRAREGIELAKLTGGLNDPNVAYKNKRPNEGDEDEDEEEQPKKKRKGPKEPNPLSVKQKKAINVITKPAESETKEPKKRRRRHHRGSKLDGNEDLQRDEGDANDDE
jgi:U3 small nucleolar RNA-associated protein 23